MTFDLKLLNDLDLKLLNDLDDREIFTRVKDENPRLNEYLVGENSDVSVYEANGVLTTPYRLGLYQDKFKNEYNAVNVKYVENLVANLNRSLTTLNRSLTTLNELYNRLDTKNVDVIENVRKLTIAKKKKKYYCCTCKLSWSFTKA